MDPAQKKSLYLKTNQLIIELNPREKESSNIDTTRVHVLEVQEAIARNDFEPAREYLRVLNDVDPANPNYTALLRKPGLTFSEFRRTMLSFYEDPVYFPRFIETLNNLKSGKEPETPKQVKTPESTETKAPKPAEGGTRKVPAEVVKKTNEVKTLAVEGRVPSKEELKVKSREIEEGTPRRQFPPKTEVSPKNNDILQVQRSQPSRVSAEPASQGVNPVPYTRQIPTGSTVPSQTSSFWSRRSIPTFIRKLAPAMRPITSEARSQIGTPLGSAVQRGIRIGVPNTLGGLAAGLGRGALNLIPGVNPNPARDRRGRDGGGTGSRPRGRGRSGLIKKNKKRVIIWFIIIMILFLSLTTGILSGFFGLFGGDGTQGDFDIIKSAPDEVGNGELITYQLTVINKGNTVADVEVSDSLPQDTKFVSAKSSVTQPGGFYDQQLNGPEGRFQGGKVVWNLKAVSPGQPNFLTLVLQPTKEDTWVVNEAVTNKPAGEASVGKPGVVPILYGDVTGLLPAELPLPPADWDRVKAQILGAFNKYPDVVESYKQAAQATGIPWQILAGLHFVETGSNPRPGTSLVSGREIGQLEPDVPRSACVAATFEPGTPVPVGGGCGFNSQLDSAIYAAKHLAGKIGKIPTTFQEVITAMSRYNGGGNSNCGRVSVYGPCPSQFEGEDDPYAMSDFDEAHASSKMYLIYCADFTKCNPPRGFGRSGAMAVIRALSEQ